MKIIWLTGYYGLQSDENIRIVQSNFCNSASVSVLPESGS